MAISKNQSSPDTKPGASKGSVHYEGVNEKLTLNKYHFLLIIERIQNENKPFPQLEHVMIPFAILLTTLLPLFTSTFKDALGFDANFWRNLMATIAIVSLILFVLLGALWIRNLRFKPKTPEQICSDVIDQLKQKSQ